MRRANKIIIMLYYPTITLKCFKEKIISIDMFVTPSICHFHVPEIINHWLSRNRLEEASLEAATCHEYYSLCTTSLIKKGHAGVLMSNQKATRV